MLLQEYYKNDPWKVLVSCVLLSRVHGYKAHEVAHRLFKEFPNANAFVQGNELYIKGMLRPLGFHNVRYKRILDCCMYDDFALNAKTEILPIDIVSKFVRGKYVLDSYSIFVLGNIDVEPTDKELIKYLHSLKQSNEPK